MVHCFCKSCFTSQYLQVSTCLYHSAFTRIQFWYRI